MKSIKEKSLELYTDKKVVLARGNTCLSCGRVKRESFEAGANYVLEQIEQLIYEKHVEGNLPLFDLTYLIDKLKEK